MESFKTNFLDFQSLTALNFPALEKKREI